MNEEFINIYSQVKKKIAILRYKNREVDTVYARSKRVKKAHYIEYKLDKLEEEIDEILDSNDCESIYRLYDILHLLHNKKLFFRK